MSEGGTTKAAVLAKINDMESQYTSLQNEMNGMKEKCNILEDKCDSLQRSVEILSKESKWEYSAPPIPDSYWEDETEFYINRIDDFLREVKSCACQLRKGEETSIELQVGFINGGTVIRHDDILLPHWKELANAVQLYHNPDGLNSVTLKDVQLTTSVMDLLTSVMKGYIMKSFTLSNNSFVDIREGIEFAVQVIKTNPNMKYFFWDYNQLESIENARLVLDAVISHPSIHRIRLESCLNGDMHGYEALCYLLASGKSLKLIDLEKNNIQTRGGTAIPNYIASNPPVQSLYLSDNKLNDDDAILIADALKKNSNLFELILDNNDDITDIGHNVLTKVVYDPTSLNSMSDCNHTCCIELDEGMDVPIGCNNSDTLKTTTITRRRIKIYNSNVKHLNAEFEIDDEERGNSLKLVPNVLECIHRYYPTEMRLSRKMAPPLSIMLEVLRGWKMPELFKKRS